MSAHDNLLFIDSNKYLDLFRTDRGKKLLAPLGEQVEYIFITKQVADEVLRNKIQVAAEFLGQKSKGLKLQTFSVPDHLSGSTGGQASPVLDLMREIGDKITQVNREVDALVLRIMEQIRLSEDEVSRSLVPIFAKAVSHSPEELNRARSRRERGNPPGKSMNPIGDQLTWEQILTAFRGKKRLWIISRDGDYGTLFAGKGLLNGLLYADLCEIAPAPEVYLFEDMVEGITHFVATTGVRAEKKLTPQEAKEIGIEEKALPHLNLASEDARQVLAALAKPNQAFEEMRWTFAEFAKPNLISEDLRRTLAEYAKPSQALEAMHRTFVEYGKATTEVSEELRRTLAEYAKPNQGFEEMHRTFAEYSKATGRVSEELRRTFAEYAEPNQAFEEMRRISAELAKPNRSIDELRRAFDEIPRHDSPTESSTPADASVLTPLSEGLFSADFLNVAGRLWQTSDAKNGVLSGTWVTGHSEHIGNTLRHLGVPQNAVAGVLQDGRTAAVRGSTAGRREDGGAVPRVRYLAQDRLQTLRSLQELRC